MAAGRTAAHRLDRGRPVRRAARPCLAVRAGGRLSIETLTFDVREQRIHAVEGDRDLSDGIEWATYGQQVLRSGSVARVDDIIDEFYDLRHVLAFDHRHEQGERIRQEIYDGYPGQFRERALRAWRDGTPRARYSTTRWDCRPVR